jgi:two-component system response regulator NreC
VNKVRVLIVDDHTILRDGLQALLNSESDFEVVSTESNARDALRNIGALAPDLVLMDLTMPGTSGIEAIAQIKRKYREIKVVALTFHKEDQYIHATLEAGTDGYVLKDDGRVELFTALRSVMKGKSYLSPSICSQVVHGYLAGGERSSDQAPWDVLTPREREVMKLIAEGHRTNQIAVYLSLSSKTVEKHRTNLMRKLNLHSVSAVTAYAIANGFVIQR